MNNELLEKIMNAQNRQIELLLGLVERNERRIAKLELEQKTSNSQSKTVQYDFLPKGVAEARYEYNRRSGY